MITEAQAAASVDHGRRAAAGSTGERRDTRLEVALLDRGAHPVLQRIGHERWLIVEIHEQEAGTVLGAQLRQQCNILGPADQGDGRLFLNR